MSPSHARSARPALLAGIAVPVIYFGTQLLAARFFPGYSFRARDASTLGGPGSTAPAIFNTGAILVGVLLVIAAWGFAREIQGRASAPVVAWLTGLSLLAGGISSVNAGLHPLPDPRHTEGVLAALGAGFFFAPLLLLLAAKRLAPQTPALKAYLAANLVVIVGLALLMSGLVQRMSIMAGAEMPGLQTFLNENQGLLQRVAAVCVFVPIGVCAAVFGSRSQSP